MKKNKVEIDDNLVADLKKYSNIIAKSMATQFREELYSTAQYAIDLFYKDYKPVSYKRHYYNFNENSYKKYYKNPHNQVFYGGVELTPEDLEPIYNHLGPESNYIANGGDPYYIFNLVYSGYHGNVKMLPNYEYITHVPPIMNPSPLEIILNKRDDMIDNIYKYVDVAKTVATTVKYQYIEF